MKKIIFSKLVIKNFRNINELEINFKEHFNEIQGENGLGKTNTLSAMLWCLFGKNIEDNKQFVISPIINGVEDNSINTIVKLVLNDSYVIERSYKNRKTELKTGWIIDGSENLISITQAKYNQELIDNFVDEETFKSLSNINYIPNLHWKDLKKLIFDLIGDITDDEVLIRDDFELIEEYVRKFGIDQTQKLLQETDKQLNEEIKRLETEYQTLLNTKEKYVANEDESKQLLDRKKAIEKELYDIEEENKKINESINNYKDKKRDLDQLEYEYKSKQNELVYITYLIQDYNNLYKSNGVNVDSLKENKTKQILTELDDLKYQEEDIKKKIEQIEINIDYLKTKGNELKSKEIKIENNKCSACGQPLPEEIIKSTLKKLKEQQLEELQEIKSDYDLEKEKLENQNNKLRDILVKNHELNQDLENSDNWEFEVDNSETDKQKEIRIKKETKELELKDKTKELDAIMVKLTKLRVEFNDLKEPSSEMKDNSKLKEELDEINEKLATTITLNKISEDIDKSLNELNSKKDSKIVNKDKLQQVVKFNNIKAELLQKKVKTYFNICEFRTKETTLNGDEVECFKIVDSNNIEYKEVNSAKRILMGIDLITGIQKAKNIYLPLIVDNIETVTSDIQTETQLIVARAIKGVNKLEIK